MPMLDQVDPSIATKHFSRSLLTAIENARIPSLGEGPRNSDLASLLKNGSSGQLLDTPLSSHTQLALDAALWLLAGDLDRSHSISQDLHTEMGSFLHGVMHRREGDFSNAKYWFRKCENLALLNPLGKISAADEVAGQVTQSVPWDPFQFVDQCQVATRKGGELEQQCIRAQWIEWQLVLTSILPY